MSPKHLLVIAIPLITGYLNAQTNLQIKDILVSPVMGIDTITNLPIYNNTEQIAVLCKANNVPLIESVHILIDTSQNVGDILTINANLILQDGLYLLTYTK